MNTDVTNKPLAIAGLTSYRYKGPWGWIMIGAKDHEGAFREARRSTHAKIEPENLEVWNATCGMYMPALKPLFEAGNDEKGLYAKVLPFEGFFKVVAYDADGDVRTTLCLYTSDLAVAKDYASQFGDGKQPVAQHQ